MATEAEDDYGLENCMAFDGIVISALAEELREKLVGGRIVKISQPEKEELILTVKNYEQYRLFLSVGAGLPLVYLTEENKPAPLTAPNFCMFRNRKRMPNGSNSLWMLFTVPDCVTSLPSKIRFRAKAMPETGWTMSAAKLRSAIM